MLVLFAVVAILAGAAFARFYLVTWLGERVVADVRRDVFRHVIGLSPASSRPPAPASAARA
ncbi:MAG: hypothetical protein U5L08_06325 [Xanthomonadales bacterium]|nr:hypothetical protein [Xanthomonadales bacterium]